MLKYSKTICTQFITLQNGLKRSYAARKKFYRKTSVLQSDGKFEITLDHRKLKTPTGTPFVVNSEPLAIAVATEWENQKDVINASTMHLTSLCNTAIDNPNRLNKADMVNYILNYIPTDTVLFQSMEQEDLFTLQSREWDPIIEWFNKRYSTDLKKTTDIITPVVTGETKMNISKYLMSYDTPAIHGFIYAVDTLKSVILAFACVDRKLTVDQAVHLARLEEEFQLKFWGRVEWAHDLGQQDLQARLSAAVLFIYFNSSNQFVKQKMSL